MKVKMKKMTKEQNKLFRLLCEANMTAMLLDHRCLLKHLGMQTDTVDHVQTWRAPLSLVPRWLTSAMVLNEFLMVHMD